MNPTTGTLLSGRYLLGERIGAGGMSTVYLATDRVLERQVAVKVLNLETTGDETELKRFKQEAKAVAKLSHPNVVAVIDAGEDAGRSYIVFEYIKGQDLKQRIEASGQLEIVEALAYGIEIARGLLCAHGQGLVHRDVKPQNVLIGPDGSAKVTDFGIARTVEQIGITDTGKLLGTTDYIAPEQALGEAATVRTDIYSLGIVLYEMLTGDVPFKAHNQVAVAMMHVREQFPDIQALRPDVSAALAAVIEQATAKDPAERYQSTEQLITDLEAVLALEMSRSGHAVGEATSVMRTLPPDTKSRLPYRFRHPAVLLAVVVAAVLLAVVIGVFVFDQTKRGTGGSQAPPEGLKRISLGQRAASDFDPLGGDGEHSNETVFALDRDPNTSWSTENYNGGLLSKAGVGLIIDAKPRVAARALTLTTPESGFDVEIYAARKDKPKTAPPSSDWIKLSESKKVDNRRTQITLDSAGQKFRYYLIWITSVPKSGKVKITEAYLFR